MLRHNNTSTLLCEEQSKFILDRISTVEKHFGEMCGAFAEFTRKLARLRDKSDELAHVTQDYSGSEKYNKSLATGLSSLSKAITLIGDFQDLEVKRLENRIVSELSQYEIVCKHCKDSVKATEINILPKNLDSVTDSLKDAIVVRDKELAKRKQLDQARARNNRGKKPAKDAELMKSNLEVTKSLKEMEEIVTKFEKQKLLDLKNLLMDFVMIELKFHSNAIEVLSATYQDISDIDENRDYQGVHKELKRQNRQFKKYLQQDELSERYFLQRIKSQSMGALSSMFAATTAGSSTGGRRNKSLSSNSLNSSQEQEDEEAAPPGNPLQMLASGSKHKGSGNVGSKGTAQRRSTDSLDSPKRDLSDESNTTTDDSDSESESDSGTDNSDEQPRKKKQQTKSTKNVEESFVKPQTTSSGGRQSPMTTFVIKSINGIVRNIKI